MTLKSIFDWAFGLPLQTEGRIPTWWRVTKSGIDPAHPADLLYLYYSVFKLALFIAIYFSLLNLASWLWGGSFKFYLFTIDLSGPEYVNRFFDTYTKYTSAIVWIVAIPYNLIRVVYIDTTIRQSIKAAALKTNKERNWSKLQLWLLLFFNLIVGLVCTYRASDLFSYYMKGLHLEHSAFYFLSCVGLLPFVLSVCSLLVYLSLSQMLILGKK
jgi:hypothetical protein